MGGEWGRGGGAVGAGEGSAKTLPSRGQNNRLPRFPQATVTPPTKMQPPPPLAVWGYKGPAGPKGATGPTGPTGPPSGGVAVAG